MVEYEGCPECGEEYKIDKKYGNDHFYCPECEIDWISCPDCGEWVDFDEFWNYQTETCVNCGDEEDHSNIVVIQLGGTNGDEGFEDLVHTMEEYFGEE